MNTQSIKEQNRGLILRLICCGAARSRIEIAKQTGLSKMAVTNITAQLIEQDYICETSLFNNSKVGRNPMVLALSENSPRILGLYIARDAIHAALSDMSCNIEKSLTEPLCEESAESLCTKIILLLNKVKLFAKGKRVLGIGVAAIGPLDCESGTILQPSDFYGIKSLPIRSLLEKEFALPVYMNNDMNAAALSELMFAPVKETEFLYIGLAHGVGAGIVSGGSLYQSSNSFAGEIGHMSIDKSGPKCACGQRGCLELYVSMTVILKELSAALGKSVESSKKIEEVMSLPSCSAVINEVIDSLSCGVINAVNLLNPKAVIIGHEGANLPPSMLKRLQQRVNENMFTRANNKIVVRAASFGENAPLAGSICCVLENIFR